MFQKFQGHVSVWFIGGYDSLQHFSWLVTPRLFLSLASIGEAVTFASNKISGHDLNSYTEFCIDSCKG